MPPNRWHPNATCQARADGWCTQNCLDKIAGHTPSCGGGPMVARCSGVSDHPGTAWRCYGVSTLSPNREHYANGSCFCSMTAGIEAALAQCGESPPPGGCSAPLGPPGPSPLPPASELPKMFRRLLGNLSKVMTKAKKTVVVDVTSTWHGAFLTWCFGHQGIPAWTPSSP